MKLGGITYPVNKHVEKECVLHSQKVVGLND